VWRGVLLSGILAVGAFGEDQPAQPGELTWDDREKVFFAKPGDTQAKITFEVTNGTGAEVTIFRIQPSCGCTTVEAPATPWVLAPTASGTVRVAVDLKNKYGNIEKTLSVESSLGEETLTLRLFLPPMTAGNDPRARNQRVARTDRQAVFQGDCARCHVPSATAVGGAALFKAACAICHEAPARAAMVPDLAAEKAGRDAAYWSRWVSEGRADSLMPAFARKNGGVLTDEQIQQLVSYLAGRFGETVSNVLSGERAKNLEPPASHR
jgi:mono/diheme cytochrome c family protein